MKKNTSLALNTDNIKSKIYTIRGMQVMLDADLAELYNVEPKRLNEQVKRNIERFPENFMFQLTEEEYNSLRSQIVTLNNLKSEFTTQNEGNLKSQFATSSVEPLRSQIVTSMYKPLNPKKMASGAEFIHPTDTLEKEGYGDLKSQFTTSNRQNLKSQIVISRWGGRRALPYAFTEQGVAMLSGVLKSETAVRISIQIINAFVVMKKFISSNAQIFQRLDNVERKQIEYDKNFEQVFDAIQGKELKPEKGIFFDGQIFDSYKFVSDIIRTADKSIILVDNYIDDSVLTLFSKRNKNVQVTIFTKDISKQLSLDLTKYN